MQETISPDIELPELTQPRDSSLMKVFIAFILFIIITGITLAFGLFPHDDYASKWVSPSSDTEGVAFGRYGVAHGEFPDTGKLHGTKNNLDIKLDLIISEPETSAFQVLAYIGQVDDEIPLIIGQWKTYILVLQGYDFSGQEELPRLSFNAESLIGTPISMHILLSDSRNVLYVNGEPVSVHSPTTYFLEKTDKVISLGNTLDGRHGWSGTVIKFTVARYNKATADESLILEYDFSDVVNDEYILEVAAGNHSLKIPAVGEYPKTLFLSDRKIQNLLDGSPFDLFINFVGFIPFVMALAYFLKTAFAHIPWWVLTPLTLAGGVATSLAIEFYQTRIPGRNSDLHDLVLNSASSLLGVIAFYFILSLIRPKIEIEKSSW